MTNAILSWSSGKDSAYSLLLLQKSRRLNIKGLLTTINKRFDRVAMHSTRLDLLEQQSKALNLPLWKVQIPDKCTNAEYESAMTRFCLAAKKRKITTIAFGDIHLRDVKDYRVKNLNKVGMKANFPIWNKNPSKLAVSIVKSGLKAKIICVDTNLLSESFLGRDYDSNFLKDIPKSVDPCGERGEFHTFCTYAPNFKWSINVKLGRLKRQSNFSFVDIVSV